MNPSEEKKSEQQGDQSNEDPLPPQLPKDLPMTSSSSDNTFVLSCWWSRGPSGQVQEWEARPATPKPAPRTNAEHRSASSRWRRNLKNRKRSTT